MAQEIARFIEIDNTCNNAQKTLQEKVFLYNKSR